MCNYIGRLRGDGTKLDGVVSNLPDHFHNMLPRIYSSEGDDFMDIDVSKIRVDGKKLNGVVTGFSLTFDPEKIENRKATIYYEVDGDFTILTCSLNRITLAN